MTYLDAAYDLENVHEICLSGDGANWIKTGLGVIPKSKYYLDRFHLEKYLKKASNPIESARGTNGKYLWKLRDEIKLGNKREVAILLDSYMGYGRTKSQEEAIAESKAYIMNNWEGIQNSLESDYRGCSAEGHVSHVLSDRLSSRPLGWSLKGAENVARLRVFGLNGGNLGQYYLEKARKKHHEDRIVKIEKHILRKKAKYPVREGSINYATPHFGWYKAV